MTGARPPYLVSTDLDGTLLDHHTYSWKAAEPALAKLRAMGIPVVINTSKTCPEVLALQRELGIRDPFIVENGSAVFIHRNDTRFERRDMLPYESEWLYQILGCARQPITNTLTHARNKHHWDFSTFSDFSVEQVMELTGLPKTGATMARQRMFTEPLVWNDSERAFAEFARVIEDQGLKILRGGRFIHILGQTNKGKAISWLSKRLTGTDDTAEPAKIIALGDSQNDLDMLEVADIPVLVRSPAHEFPEFSHDHLIHTKETGPKGWNSTLKGLI